MKNLYRLEVAPLVVLPLHRSGFFSYVSVLPVAPGSLVSISFGRREIKGVVYDCVILPGIRPAWMKAVTKVITENFLTEAQRALALSISEEYFTPLGRVLNHFIPPQVKARSKQVFSSDSAQPTIKAEKEERTALAVFLKSKKTAPLYIDTSGLPNPKHFFALLAKKTLEKKQQTLILVPEISLIPGLEDTLRASFASEEVAVLHSALSAGQYFSSWESIRSGTASIVLATRQGLFAPFRDLGLVIVTEEQDESYKQWDMSPRYDGRVVASMLSALHESKLLLSSSAPSAESVYRLKEGELTPLLLLPPAPPLRKREKSLTLINLKLERFKKNYSPLSEALKDALVRVLSEKKQALLFINRQGLSAFSVCERCKEVFRCPKSSHPLNPDQDGAYRCLGCGYKTDLFPSCPKCGHLSFRSVGFGTERIEREVKRLFPHARVMRMDGSTMKSEKSLRFAYEQGMSGKIDILIGTQMAMKDPPLPKLSLVGMIDADSLLLFPDYRADEKLYQYLSRAINQVNEGQVLVQTFQPESTFFQLLLELDKEAVYERILMDRKALYYPPFSRLIKLTCRGETKEKAEKSATEACKKLGELLPSGKNYRLADTVTEERPTKKGYYESACLLRIPARKTLPRDIALFLRKLDKGCIVDVDPITLT